METPTHRSVALQQDLPLFEAINIDRIVNVASVQKRTPFRYPGGKTWLVPHVRRWLASLPARPVEFIEPFAGGAIIGMTVAAERLADHVTLVELDQDVAAVWETIINGDAEWLADRISTFDLTEDNVERALSKEHTSLRERAFQTILKNRVNRGGILAPGAGKLRYGENGKGIKSRWYPETLSKRILDIVKYRDSITFVTGDGLETLRKNSDRSNAAFFIDPPYTAAGKKAGTRLYTHYDVDHQELFKIIHSLSGSFLVTYDDAEPVRQLAKSHGLDVELVPMKNTHHAKMKELLISRDLTWLRTPPKYARETSRRYKTASRPRVARVKKAARSDPSSR
jgi:DNA adenine methylase